MLSDLISGSLLMTALFISALVAEKAVKKRKGKIPAAFAVFVCLMIVSFAAYTPVINHIAKFKTPESIFKFTHTEELVGVIEGEESCMVVFRKDKNSYGIDYYLKSDNEYQLPRSFSTKEVASSVGKYGFLSVDNVKGTNDYYFAGNVNVENDGNLTVVGNDNEELEYITIGHEHIVYDGKRITSTSLYGTFNDFSDDYCLTVNGEKISFSQS